MDYNQLGIQIQLFAVTSTIFFGNESICTTNLRQLLLLVSRNKKNFCNQIAIDEFFAANFLFAISRRVQRWLKSCVQAFHSCAEVNDRVLQFGNLIDNVLHGTFQPILSPAFKKVQGTSSTAENKNKEAKKGDGKDNNKKCKKENGNSNQVKNLGQPDEFKVAKGKIWKENFLTLLPQDQPAWNNKVKMCAH